MKIPRAFFVVISITLIQSGAAVSKPLMDSIAPTALVMVRMAIGGAFLLALPMRSPGPSPVRSPWIVLGLALGQMGASVSLYESIHRIPIGLAVTIQFLGPLGMALRGIRRWHQGLWPLVAVTGVILLAGDMSGSNEWTGVVIAGLGAASWAFYIHCLDIAGTRGGPKQIGFSMTLIGLMMLPFVADSLRHTDLPGTDWAIIVAISIVCTGLPFTLEFVGMRSMPSSVFATMMSLEPAAAALIGYLALGETLRLAQIIAVAMVVGASIGATRQLRDPERITVPQ